MAGKLRTDIASRKMTNRELRAAIANAVGNRPTETRLRKKTHNSLHAYFTGEFVRMPLEPGLPSWGTVAKRSVTEAHNVLYNPETDDDTDLDDYLRAITEAVARNRHDTDKSLHIRPMNKEELIAFRQAVRLTDDQREWTP